ncbi:MAG: aspartate/glutamate racemase family protein [bacterium]|nr:aspartate/glutamate racemase family protein [bacterium]
MNNNSPIVVFDSGVGSYSVVKVLRKILPNEDIIYLADRVSFPYGTKTHNELKSNMLSRIKWLQNKYDPKLILIASNTPSIQVLDEIRPLVTTQLFGVYPPVEQASRLTKTKSVGILATKGAVESPEIDDFIKKKNLPDDIEFIKINASILVSLVEPGTFQNDKKTTEEVIKKLLNPLLELHPDIDVMTLSSTHLPFLKDYLDILYPGVLFLDPAEDVSQQIKKHLEDENLLNHTKGKLIIITTVDMERNLTVDGLKEILLKLGLQIEVSTVDIV